MHKHSLRFCWQQLASIAFSFPSVQRLCVGGKRAASSDTAAECGKLQAERLSAGVNSEPSRRSEEQRAKEGEERERIRLCFKWERLGTKKEGTAVDSGLRVELVLESLSATTRCWLSWFLFSQEQDGATKVWLPPELGATVGPQKNVRSSCTARLLRMTLPLRYVNVCQWGASSGPARSSLLA